MQKKIERKALIVSSIINFIITGAGIWVFSVTKIQALFLDFFFSLIVFMSSILAIIISKASTRKVKSYPDGLSFLEPLYAILKSLLTLILLIVSAILVSMTAYQYFAYGNGEAMNIRPVLPYSISMVILCFGLSFFNKKQNMKIGNISTILTAESKSNFIDGLQSFGIGIAIVLLNLIDVNSNLGFLHYTGDFFITVTLVLLSLKTPVKVIITAFRELSNGTICDDEIKTDINKIVNAHLSGISVYNRCDVFKVGMFINVRIFITGEINNEIFLKLLQARLRMIKELGLSYENIKITFAF
jgi:Predicted Co/Zn/Cd cation transporters